MVSVCGPDFSQFHQAMVSGQGVQPGFEMLHTMVQQIIHQIFKNLHHCIFCIFFTLQVFQAYTQHQVGIPFKQDADPFRILVHFVASNDILVAVLVRVVFPSFMLYSEKQNRVSVLTVITKVIKRYTNCKPAKNRPESPEGNRYLKKNSMVPIWNLPNECIPLMKSKLFHYGNQKK